MEFKRLIKSFYKMPCPRCKERISAHAYQCPRCGFDFTNPQYLNSIAWQEKGIKYWLYFSLFVFIISLLNGDLGVALILFVILFFIGIFIFIKVVKWFNFFK